MNGYYYKVLSNFAYSVLQNSSVSSTSYSMINKDSVGTINVEKFREKNYRSDVYCLLEPVSRYGE